MPKICCFRCKVQRYLMYGAKIKEEKNKLKYLKKISVHEVDRDTRKVTIEDIYSNIDCYRGFRKKILWCILTHKPLITYDIASLY